MSRILIHYPLDSSSYFYHTPTLFNPPRLHTLLTVVEVTTPSVSTVTVSFPPSRTFFVTTLLPLTIEVDVEDERTEPNRPPLRVENDIGRDCDGNSS